MLRLSLIGFFIHPGGIFLEGEIGFFWRARHASPLRVTLCGN